LRAGASEALSIAQGSVGERSQQREAGDAPN